MLLLRPLPGALFSTAKDGHETNKSTQGSNQQLDEVDEKKGWEDVPVTPYKDPDLIGSESWERFDILKTKE